MGIITRFHFALLSSLFAAAVIHASDADMLQDLCVADTNSTIKVNGFVCKSAPVASDFKSQVLNKPGNTSNGLGSVVTNANVLNFQGLNTLGVAFARIDYREGGLNPPHIHPRGTELFYLVQGTLYVGFVTTAPDNKLFAQTLHPGELFVFPRGLIHFQLNIGKGPAFGFAGFNSQNPGASQVAKAVFASNPPIDDKVIEIAFQLMPEVIPKIKELIKKT